MVKSMYILLTCALLSGSVESSLALALELSSFLQQEAVGVCITVHLWSLHLARVGAFSLGNLQKTSHKTCYF